MITETINIATLKKEQSDQFPFLIRIGEVMKNKSFMNNFTGDPTLPLIGKYSRNQYHFLHVDSLCAIQLTFDDTQKQYLSQKEQLLGELDSFPIQFPQAILQILQEIPDQIVHNKPPKKNGNEQKKQSKKQSKKKNNKKQYPIQEERLYVEKKQNIQMDEEEQKQEQQLNVEDEKIFPFHPFQFKASKRVQFIWTINSLQTNKILQPLGQDPSLSYVNHNWVFEEINFEFQKRLVQMIPICIVEANGVYEWEDSFKAVKFYEIRSEYMSCHLAKDSLCFSPNNMKMGIDLKRKEILSFWSVILQEDGNHFVQICFHWITVEDQISQLLQNVTRESKTISDLMRNCEMFGGASQNVIQQTQMIFKL